MKLRLRDLIPRIRRGNILFSWIRTTLVITLACSILIIISHSVIRELIEDQISAINHGLTAQLQNRFDSQLLAVQTVGIEIKNAGYTSMIMNSADNDISSSSHAYRDMVDYIRLTQATHSYIESINIICPFKELIISADGILREALFEYSSELTGIAALNDSLIGEKPLWDRAEWITSDNNLYYLMNLPSVGGADSPLLIIKFDKNQQQIMLGAIRSKYSSVQYVSDDEGRVIFSSGTEPPEIFIASGSLILDGVGAFSAMKSVYTDLFCCSFIPEQTFLSDLRRLSLVFLGIAAAVVLFSLLFASYFILKHYLPLRKIVSGMESGLDIVPGNQNEYDRIENYSGLMLKHSKINHQRLIALEEQMRNISFERYLKGFIAFSELPEKTRSSIPLLPDWIMAEISVPNSDYPLEVIALFISEFEQNLPEEIVYQESVRMNNSVILLLGVLNRKTDLESDLQNYLEQGCLMMQEKTGYNPVIVLGRIFSGIGNAAGAYLQCSYRMKEACFFLQRGVLRVEAQASSGFVCLSPENQKALAEAVLSGDKKLASRGIASIIAAIDGEGSTSDSARCMLFSALTVIMQTVSGIPAGRDSVVCCSSAAYTEFFQSGDIQSMKGSLFRIADLVCDEIKEKRSDQTRWLINEIESYVRDNLSNRDMYLPSIAEYFGMNPRYLSAVFKENSGRGLAEYIRERRVEEACSLLQQDVAIKCVAEKSGFSNVISFNRTFKKIKKITPTEYRRDIASKKRE